MPNALVVDDLVADQRLIGGLVERNTGWSVTYAANGKEAVDRIQANSPDIVLTDLIMPEMNGLELVTKVKSDFPLLPVILLTAKGSEDIAAQALKLGAASYVPKKRLAEDLMETVERVLIAAREDRTHSQLMHYLTENESVFVLPNDLGLIRSLVSHLQQLLRCTPLDDETERMRVGMAVEEALKNAYYHGNLEVGRALDHVDRNAYDELAKQRHLEEPFQERRIHLKATVTRDQAVFIVRDEGSGFNHSQLPDAVDTTGADESSGKGIVLMRTIMDEVIYNDIGNEVTLIKRRTVDETDDEEVD